MAALVNGPSANQRKREEGEKTGEDEEKNRFDSAVGRMPRRFRFDALVVNQCLDALWVTVGLISPNQLRVDRVLTDDC